MVVLVTAIIAEWLKELQIYDFYGYLPELIIIIVLLPVSESITGKNTSVEYACPTVTMCSYP